MKSEAHDNFRPGWCCVQAGHRELYGIPRALARAGLLDGLVTDLWVPPGSWLGRLPAGPRARRLRDRYHAELAWARVTSFPLQSLAWEATAGLRRGPAALAHNAWWSDRAARALRRAMRATTGHVFSYCYGARAVFAAARELGLRRVLGQIDPGPVEDQKVADVTRRWPDYRTAFQAGTAEYYASWREECELAGAILVNSEWSREALVSAGIAPEKIELCPLVYTPPVEAAGWTKFYPQAFTASRPLRVLFLGQCILRKGLAETLAAARALRHQPVEFTLVGNTDIADLSAHFAGANVRHFPRVTREECHAFYRDADAFLFPTHSDGFGLTQLEAQAWRLPLVVSRYCATVATPGETGWLLPEVSPEAIVAAIEDMLRQPARLQDYSQQIAPWPFGLGQLGEQLAHLDARPARAAAGEPADFTAVF